MPTDPSFPWSQVYKSYKTIQQFQHSPSYCSLELDQNSSTAIWYLCIALTSDLGSSKLKLGQCEPAAAPLKYSVSLLKLWIKWHLQIGPKCQTYNSCIGDMTKQY